MVPKKQTTNKQNQNKTKNWTTNEKYTPTSEDGQCLGKDPFDVECKFITKPTMFRESEWVCLVKFFVSNKIARVEEW